MSSTVITINNWNIHILQQNTLGMDLLEDGWWPTVISSSRPFSLPPSSKWLLKHESGFVSIVAGGDHAVYRVHQEWLAFLMLLDMAQQMHLLMANSADPAHSITYYKGVMFLDSLRQDLTAGLRKREVDSFPFKKSLPESMRRWICRLLLCIPNDPENRKQNAKVLKKAYEEIDIFEYGIQLKQPSSTLSIFIFISRLLRLVTES
jgi:hypothetical protein